LSEIEEQEPKPDLVKMYGQELIGVPIVGALMVFGAGFVLSFSQRIDRALLFPPWPLLIVVGITVSVARNRSSNFLGVLFTWVFPLGYFLLFAKSLWTPKVPNYTRQVWEEMFTGTCGEECADPILACVPLVFSVSYSASALLLRLVARGKRSVKHVAPD
jgi:hypothetical protein